MSQNKITSRISVLVGLNLCCLGWAMGAQVKIFREGTLGRLSFASREIYQALMPGNTVDTLGLEQFGSTSAEKKIVLLTLKDEALLKVMEGQGLARPTELKAEGFAIRVSTAASPTYWIIGADDLGTMYGGIELAEIANLDGLNAVQNMQKNPFLEKRGYKINVPLDARTPSYADAGDAAQENLKEIWSLEFWTHKIDFLARNRYNAITLWNLHPFPSLVKVPGYERVALNDVKKSKINFWEWHSKYELFGTNMYSAEIVQEANLETVKVMTIDQKIKFWQEVMEYAYNRGIKMYLMTWNIFVSSAAEAGYGITDSHLNGVTKDYMRKSVKAVFQTYPRLAGIGVTAGENMEGVASSDKENWLWETYGQGLVDAQKENPTRKFAFIHRQLQSSMSEIKNTFKFDSTVEFDFSFKYINARLYSTTKPTFIDGVLNQLPNGSRFWLTLRDDDNFNFRWGDPDYVREFITNFPPATKIKGFHMGSDGYVWGREFTSTEPEIPRQFEFDKHWLKFMLWGQLGYDNTIPNSKFEKLIARRFPQVSASELMAVWMRASKIIPKVNRTNWINFDYSWAVEYCRSKYAVKTAFEGLQADAQELRDHATYVLEKVPALREKGGKELRLLLGDLEAMAHLANFYAAKIDGDDVKLAAGHWRKYAAVAASQYKPQLLGRAGKGDWRLIYETLDTSPMSVNATSGGTLLEAENAIATNATKANLTIGSTGTGYVLTKTTGSTLEWSYTAPKTGEYLLEFRYALGIGKSAPAAIKVNGSAGDSLILWSTGGATFWAWDRKAVKLNAGLNTITLDIKGIDPLVDHLNILYSGSSTTSLPSSVPETGVSIQSISKNGIELFLSKESDIDLEVYSLRGNKVFSLSATKQKAGDHQIPFLRKVFPPGIYFAKLAVGAAHQIRRFTVF